MKARLFRNWKTSTLGIIFLLVSIGALLLKAITGGEFVALLPTIIGLLCMPDSILKNKAIGNRQ